MTTDTGMQSSSSWFSYKTALGLGTIAAGVALYKYYPVIKNKWPSVRESIIDYWNSWGQTDSEKNKNQLHIEQRPRRSSIQLSRQLLESLRTSSSNLATIRTLSNTAQESDNQRYKDFVSVISAYLLENDDSTIEQFKEKYSKDRVVIQNFERAIVLIDEIHENTNFEEFLSTIARIDSNDSDCGVIDDLRFELYYGTENDLIGQIQSNHSNKPIFLLTTQKVTDSLKELCTDILRITDEDSLSDAFNTILAIEDEEPVIIFWTDNQDLAKCYKELILTEAYCIDNECEPDALLEINKQNNERYGQLLNYLRKYTNGKKNGHRPCHNSFKKDDRWAIDEKLTWCSDQIDQLSTAIQTNLKEAADEAFKLDSQQYQPIKRRILKVAAQINLEKELTAYFKQLELARSKANSEGSSSSSSS